LEDPAVTSARAAVIPTIFAAVSPLPVIDIDVLVSVIGIVPVVRVSVFDPVDDVLAGLAARVVLLELLEPQPAATSAAPASGTIR
jgi:hypothetical protein